MIFEYFLSKRPKWTITLPHLPLFPSTSGQMAGRVGNSGKIGGTSTLPHSSTLPVSFAWWACFCGKCGRVWKSTIFNPSRLSTSYNYLKSGRVEELLGGVPGVLFFLAAAFKSRTPHIWGYGLFCKHVGYPWRIDAGGKILVDDPSSSDRGVVFFTQVGLSIGHSGRNKEMIMLITVKQWELGEPFVKFNQIVGYHLLINNVSHSLHFSSLAKRLNARWDEIAKELTRLGAWWESADTPHNSENTRIYLEMGELLVAERRQLETIWIEIRPYVMGKEEPAWKSVH